MIDLTELSTLLARPANTRMDEREVAEQQDRFLRMVTRDTISPESAFPVSGHSKSGSFVTWHAASDSYARGLLAGLTQRVWTRHDESPALDGSLYVAMAPRSCTRMGVAPLTEPSPVPAYSMKRGGKADLSGAPHVWWADMDLDLPGHRHKAARLLSVAQLHEILMQLDGFGLSPTCIVATGGGAHLYWASTEPVGLDEWVSTALRIESFLKWCAERFEVQLDTGVTKDVARVLRCPGSPSKGWGGSARIVTLEESLTYAPNDFDVLPQEEPIQPPARPAKSVAGDQVFQVMPDRRREGARPGDIFNSTAGAHQLLVALGCRHDRARRYTYPREDGTFGDSALQVYSDEANVMVNAFGNRAESAFGRKALQPFTLFAKVYCGGNFGLAARICAAAGSAEAALSTVDGSSAAELADRFPPSTPTRSFEDVPPPSASGQGVVPHGPPVSWPELIESKRGWTIVEYAHSERSWLVVVLGHSAHGIWRVKAVTEKRAEGEETTVADWRQLSRAVLWRSASTSVRRGDVEVSERLYDVQILLPDGRSATIPGLTGGDSMAPKRLQEASPLPFSLPAGAVDLNDVRSCLSLAGEASRAERVEYLSTGWISHASGQHVYAAPAGSIDRHGVRRDVTVRTTPGAETQRRTGWHALPESPQQLGLAVEAVGALLQLLPLRPEWGVGAVGLSFAAPLALRRRTTLVVVGKPDSRKSLLMAEQAPLWRVGEVERTFGLYVPQATSVGAAGELAWNRHGLAMIDDYRRGKGRDALSSNQRAFEVVQTCLQGCYSANAERKKTQTGQLRATESIECAGMLTAETHVGETALVERSVTLELLPTDVPQQGDPDDPIASFRSRFRPEDLNSGFAAYLSWLAGRLDSEWGSVDAMAAWGTQWTQRKASALGRNRAGEGVAYLSLGIEMLYRWANEVGYVDLLPAREWVDEQLESLTAGTQVVSSGLSLTEQLLGAMRDMLEGRRGYLLSADGDTPSDPGRSGWTYNHSTLSWMPSGELLGAWTPSGDRVVLQNSAVRALMREGNLEGLTYEQVKTALATLHMEPWPAGDRVSTNLGMKAKGRASRPRGFVILAEVIFGDEGSERVTADCEDGGKPDF